MNALTNHSPPPFPLPALEAQAMQTALCAPELSLRWQKTQVEIRNNLNGTQYRAWIYLFEGESSAVQIKIRMTWPGSDCYASFIKAKSGQREESFALEEYLKSERNIEVSSLLSPSAYLELLQENLKKDIKLQRAVSGGEWPKVAADYLGYK
jgi:hypothetical protein